MTWIRLVNHIDRLWWFFFWTTYNLKQRYLILYEHFNYVYILQCIYVIQTSTRDWHIAIWISPTMKLSHSVLVHTVIQTCVYARLAYCYLNISNNEAFSQCTCTYSNIDMCIREIGILVYSIIYTSTLLQYSTVREIGILLHISTPIWGNHVPHILIWICQSVWVTGQRLSPGMRRCVSKICQY